MPAGFGVGLWAFQVVLPARVGAYWCHGSAVDAAVSFGYECDGINFAHTYGR